MDQRSMGQTRKAPTILLVEDYELVRGAIASLLKNAGYTVLEAGTPMEAAMIADQKDSAVDLLVTDIVLPGKSGLELARHLTARYPGLRVLYVTASPPSEALSPGAALLRKPFHRDVLLAKVREVLDGPP